MTMLPGLEYALRAAVREHQRAHTSRRMSKRLPASRGVGRLVPAAGVAVAIIVAALALGLTRSDRQQHPAPAGRADVPVGARELVSILGVLRRPQTGRDAAVLASVRRVERLSRATLASPTGTRGARARSRQELTVNTRDLHDIVGSLTREVGAVRGAGDVFLVVHPHPISAGGDTAELLFVLNSSRSPVVFTNTAGETAAQIRQQIIHVGCFGPVGQASVSTNIGPDGVARMQLTFSPRGAIASGNRPLRHITAVVHNNVLIETVHNPMCEIPDVTRLYAPDGQPLLTARTSP
jgi:hypothetical protein